jgi:hypothetical protein
MLLLLHKMKEDECRECWIRVTFARNNTSLLQSVTYHKAPPPPTLRLVAVTDYKTTHL